MMLITGATGLLGANMVMTFASRGEDVVGLCRNPFNSGDITFFNADITHKGETEAYIRSLKPSSVVHCAAATNVDRCEDAPEEAMMANAESTGRLAETSRSVGARFVYISTDAVYKGDRGGYTEEDETWPVNEYGKSKLAGEKMAIEADPDALVLRTNMYGWNAQEKSSLAEWILGKLANSENLNGFSDVIFTPLLVNDLADITLELVKKDVTGIVNLGCSEAISKYEFARAVARTFGCDEELITSSSVRDIDFKAPRPLDTSMNTDKLEGLLGRKPPGVTESLIRFKKLREDRYFTRLKAMARRV